MAQEAGSDIADVGADIEKDISRPRVVRQDLHHGSIKLTAEKQVTTDQITGENIDLETVAVSCGLLTATEINVSGEQIQQSTGAVRERPVAS